MATAGAKKTRSKEKPGKSPAVLPTLKPAERVELLRKMVLIRRFEQKAAQAFMQAKITTARFYADHHLVKVPTLRDSIVQGAECVTALAVDAF